MKKTFVLTPICCLILFTAIIPWKLYAQSSVNRDTVLIAAREIVGFSA